MDPIHFISKPFFMKNVLSFKKSKIIFFFFNDNLVCLLFNDSGQDFMIDLGHNFTTWLLLFCLMLLSMIQINWTCGPKKQTNIPFKNLTIMCVCVFFGCVFS